MNDLERDFPDVHFVYMTGHLDGSGLTGNLHLRNEQIRNYCRENKKILYDFADIECYNPDGTYLAAENPTMHALMTLTMMVHVTGTGQQSGKTLIHRE